MKLLITWNSTRTKLWIHILHPSLLRGENSKSSHVAWQREAWGGKKFFPSSRFFFLSISNTHTKVTHQHSLVCLPFHMMIFMIFSAVLAAAPCCHRHQRSTLLFLLFFHSPHWIYLLLFFAAVADLTSHYRGGLGRGEPAADKGELVIILWWSVVESGRQNAFLHSAMSSRRVEFHNKRLSIIEFRVEFNEMMLFDGCSKLRK